MNTDFNIGAMGDVALSRATASKRDSIASLSSGRKQNQSRVDPGAFSLSQRLQVQSVSNQGAKVAIQNAMSIAHTQEEALNRMSKLLTKMKQFHKIHKGEPSAQTPQTDEMTRMLFRQSTT